MMCHINLEQAESMYATFIKASALQTTRIHVDAPCIELLTLICMDVSECQIIDSFIL